MGTQAYFVGLEHIFEAINVTSIEHSLQVYYPGAFGLNYIDSPAVNVC